MDNGNRYLKTGQYEKTIKDFGGKSYSMITKDKTTFSTTAPKNLLETIFWIESARIGYLADSITEKSFDAVKGRITQFIYDSLFKNPYGLASSLTDKNLYPFAHPYSWPYFGVLEHYEKFTYIELKQYFLDWYGANNMIITICGDVNPEEVLNMAVKYFSPLTKASKEVNYTNDLMNRITQGGNFDNMDPRYISYQSDIKRPMLTIAFFTVPKNHPDEPALNVLADILGNGPKSILSRELVDKGYAVYATARHNTYKYYGEFVIQIIAQSDTSLSVIRKKFNNIINDILRQHKLVFKTFEPNISEVTPEGMVIPPPPPPPDNKQNVDNIDANVIQKNESQSGELIQKIIMGYQADRILSFEALNNRGIAISDFEFYQKKPQLIDASIQAYGNVDLISIIDVIKKYVTPNQQLFISFVPNNKKNLIVAPDNTQELNLQTILTPTKESDLKYRFPKTTVYDKIPVIKGTFVPDIGPYNQETTQNGIKIITSINNSINVISIQVRIKCDKLVRLITQYNAADLIAVLMTDFVDNNTNPENILHNLKVTGTKIDFQSDKNDLVLQILTKPEGFNAVKEGLQHFLFRPEVCINSILPQFINIFDNVNHIDLKKQIDFDNMANAIAYKIIKHNSDGEYTDSFMISVMKRRSLISVVSQLFSPHNLSILIYGNIDPVMTIQFVQMIGHWMPQPSNFQPDNINVDSIKSASVESMGKSNILIYNTGKSDSSGKIRMIVNYLNTPIDLSSDFYTGSLFNFILGKYLQNSAILKNKLTEVQTKSYINRGKVNYDIVASFETEQYDSVFSIIMKEINNLKSIKIPKKQLELYKLQFLLKDLANYETSIQKSALINMLSNNNLSSDYFKTQQSIVKKIKNSGLKKYAGTNFNEEKILILVIGNKEYITGKLNKPQRQFLEVDKTGGILNL
jgi:zinc protease